MTINNFDICYQTESGDYIAPQHLPDNPPEQYVWHTNPKEPALEFRFQYPIMPKGLVTRLIVRLSAYIENVDGVEVVWKKGAILRIEKDAEACRVLIKEDNAESQEGLRQIIIQVMGEIESRKYALQRVREEVNTLHRKWFRSIQAQEIIPCCCEDCCYADKRERYLLKDLLKLRKKALKRQCNTGNMIAIQTLLEGVYQADEINNFDRANQQDREPIHIKNTIHVENNPVISNTVTTPPYTPADLAELKSLLQQLGETKSDQLKSFVDTLPEPELPAEQTTTGKQIGRWLNKNAEGIAVNVSASVYYEALKVLFGL